MSIEINAIEIVVGLMALSARTAPKAKGIDVLVTRIVREDELTQLASAMRSIGESNNIKFFLRDAKNVEQSDAVLLLGVKKEPTAGLNCGACGYSTCTEMLNYQPLHIEKTLMNGPNCAIRMIDLGIAIGSAVKTASTHNVDNRVMFSIGVAALSMGWLEECTTGLGIPLKAAGKNIFFDR